MPNEVTLTKKECDSPKDIIGKLKSGDTCKIKLILKEKEVYLLEIEDTLFRHKSAVFLPDNQQREEGGTNQQEFEDGLLVLSDVLKWAASHTNYKLLLAGHTDTSGPDDYNFTLSKARADSVLNLLIEKKDAWVSIVSNYNTVLDKQHILKWMATTYSWDCDPGAFDGKDGTATQNATKIFQKEAGISSDGVFGYQTWGAVFDRYQLYLSEKMNADEEGKAALSNRTSLNWAYPDKKAVGCGELWPLAYVGQDDLKSQVNRRVEVLFFEESLTPECKCTSGICSKDKCPIYPSGLFTRKYINRENPPVVENDYLFHIHIDADRDGIVDDDWAENEKWELGKGKKGAIVRHNNDNDDDDSSKIRDFENSEIDQLNDLDDIAQLQLRKKVNGTSFPIGWELVLEVSDKTKIRIFDTCDAAGKEIIGPSTGKMFIFKDLSPDKFQLGMEALEYPGITFDPPEIKLTITINDDKGIAQHQEKATVRVAPWIMFHHLNTTEEVYVVETGDNSKFRTELSGAIGSVPLQLAPNTPYGNDRWMQDVMEIGYSSFPSDKSSDTWNLPAAMRTFNDRPNMRWGVLDSYPKNNLLGPGYAFHQTSKPGKGCSLDSFGNLECSPPVTVKGKEYKFGRIVYGEGTGSHRMHKSVRDFLQAQKIQEPFSIDTGWLAVGHVDEIFSFCPMKDAPKKFRVLAASPLVAIDILKDLESDGKGDTKLFNAVRDTTYTKGRMEPQDIYTLQTAKEIVTDKNFTKIQEDVQKLIDTQKEVFKTNLGLDDTDFIDLPVLFRSKPKRAGYVAYTAGVVNMLVVTHSGGARLCIPKPFGPVDGSSCLFEEDIINKLGPTGSSTTGLDYTFIDDFFTYHVLDGEIHCGTNSKRTASTDLWWWEQEV